MRTFQLCASVILLVPAVGLAQEPPAAPERPSGFGMRGAAEPEIKPYEKVITKEAKTDRGVFIVHQLKGKTYYEIPKRELGEDFLWVSQIAKTTLGVGYGGQAAGNHVVRWERHDKRVLLRSISYEIVADGTLPIARAVQAANNDTILMAFNIEALGKDDAPVIDVTRLFTTEVPEFSARSRLRARGFDSNRSFLERVAVFPTNIEVEATHTFTSPIEPPSFTPSGPRTPSPRPSFFGSGMRPGSATVLMHYSMVKLPENPMTPRLFDERVGYFNVTQQDFGRDEHRAPKRTYITRWRLEKKDPGAALSEPVKPITYYVDPATPAKWVPWVKKGIEDWQPAFEQAGFSHAIVAREAPTDDSNWSPEDARYSVIRWLPSTIENAMGPHIHDPRTGEILDADIQFYQNVLNLATQWYFVQVSPLDARARKLPLPDDLMGRLIEYVVAHEVGHTLGFQHNMKASSTYPAAKVRDREWVHKMGHTPSIMDYSRFNYVAQPEDHIDPADLVPGIGPYDKWAAMWGYRPIPGARTPDDEKVTLDQWARQQEQTPWYRFSTTRSNGSDPGELTEAVGDADAVRSTALGMKNLQRVMSYLLEGAAGKPGDNWDQLDQTYGNLLGQWALEMGHVAAIVGGLDSQERHVGQQGVRFTPVPREKQAAAVAFLNENAFTTPRFLIRPEILRRIGPSGEIDRIRATQMRVLTNLLMNTRLERLEEEEAIDGSTAYNPADFLADVRKGIWKELGAPAVTIDPYRRNLQRAYLELLDGKLNGREPGSDEARPLIRGELKSLSAEIARALPRTADRVTRLHLEDARDRIARSLDPKFLPPATAMPPVFSRRPGAEDTCFPDYIIQ